MTWSSPGLTIRNVSVGARGADKSVALTLGGGGLNGDPATYVAYLLKPKAEAVAIIPAVLEETGALVGKSVLKCEKAGVDQPAQNTMVCKFADPPSGRYILVITQLARGEMFAVHWPDEVEIPH